MGALAILAVAFLIMYGFVELCDWLARKGIL
jgi:hypothetical protein